MVIEKNNENLSVVGIKEYTDHHGSQVRFETEDNLRVITSTFQTQLLKVSTRQALKSYTHSLAKEENIINYDELQGTEIDYPPDHWNKDLVDTHYTYNKAIILSDEGATITEINKWRSCQDDKIQIKLKDDTCILTNIDRVKLINDENAKSDSLKNHAISLVGSEEKIVFLNKQKTK